MKGIIKLHKAVHLLEQAVNAVARSTQLPVTAALSFMEYEAFVDAQRTDATCVVCGVEFVVEYKTSKLKKETYTTAKYMAHIMDYEKREIVCLYFTCSDVCCDAAYRIIDQIERKKVQEWRDLQRGKRLLTEARRYLRKSHEASGLQSEASEPATTSPTS